MSVGAPAYLWLLPLLAVVWFAGRAHTGERRYTAHAAVRFALLACLVVALAQPVLSFAASRTAVTYLVDVSHSVSARAIAAAADRIDAVNATLRPDAWQILAFGRDTAPVADTAALRRLGESDAADAIAGRVLPDGTNLEQALAAARGAVRAATNGRIVLFSDGRETEGDGLRMARRLAADRVPIFAEPSRTRDLGDTWIQDIALSHPAVAEAVTTVDVVVGSQVAVTAEISLVEGTRVLARTRAPIARGGTTVPIDVSFRDAGPHLVEARVDAASDVLASNNTLERELVVAPAMRVLFVPADAGAPGPAAAALAQSGMRLTVAEPRELPRTPQAFDRWDVVVLSNIGRALVPADAMTALGSWVEDRGGGLFFIGGNAVFGEGLDGRNGYRRSELERVLPVTFDRDDEPDVALVVVLDRSWSMNGTAMDLAKAAAEAAAGTLPGRELAGVLSFNHLYNWDVPLARVRDSRATLHDAIAGITASGPTAIYPALEQAYGALAAVRARAKHVILFSDGQTAAMDFEGLVRKMTAAKITVSSVAFGPEADVALLRNIARWGGGRDYVVSDAQQIPAIFVKEARSASVKDAQSASTRSGDEPAIVPVVAGGSAILERVGTLPPLVERNPVTPRAGATELVTTTRKDPLLTMWPAGLGRTAMFAADADGRWTSEWMRWPRFGAFLAAVVRSLAPVGRATSSLEVHVGERQGSRVAFDVALEVRDADRRPATLLTPSVGVESGARRAVVALTEVAPGRDGAPIVADASDPIALEVNGPAPLQQASRILVEDAAAEYRFAPPDETRLAAIAQASGGTLRPTDDDLRRAPQAPGLARRALAPWLLALALLLWPVDIALRRFQV